MCLSECYLFIHREPVFFFQKVRFKHFKRILYKNNLKQLWFINCVCFITALHYSWGNTARLSVWIQSLWTFSVLFFFSDQRLLFAFFLFVIVILTWIQCQNVWRAYVVLCSLLDAADTNGSVLFCSLHCKELHYIILQIF